MWTLNAVCVPDGRQAVSNDDDGAALADLGHVFLRQHQQPHLSRGLRVLVLLTIFGVQVFVEVQANSRDWRMSSLYDDLLLRISRLPIVS